MAFDNLTAKLQNVFKNLRSKGRLTEADVKTALKEVKMALLEADVNFKVVKQFVKDVEERAVGQDVMNGLNPGQMVEDVRLAVNGKVKVEHFGRLGGIVFTPDEVLNALKKNFEL